MHYKTHGVKTIYSPNPWLHIGISYFTHGNEPVGKKIVDYLLNIYEIEKKITAWTLSFIHVNLEASKQKKRYINHNMNRIRNQDFQENSYEHQRKNELLPLLDTLDILFDIHSTSKPSPCICITDEQFLTKAKWFFSGEEIWIGDMVKQWAMISYVTNKWKPWFGIEAGSHNDEQWYQQWVINVLNFLSLYWIIQEPLHNIHYKKIYRFLDEIFCTQTPFQYAKDFVWICSVLPWAIIADDGKNIIRNHYTEPNIYFWLATNNPIPWDWAGFFFEQIE